MRFSIRKRLSLVTTVFAISILSCQSIPFIPTQTPLPTYTLYPTYTTVPTYTPYPSLTPVATYTPYPTYTPFPISTPLPSVGPAYFDDFSTSDSGWAQYEGADGTNDYADDGYRIVVNDTEYLSWSIIDEVFADATIVVDVLSLGGPFDAEAGVVCRYQDDDNFYFFTYTADGYYAISKLQDSDFEVLSNGEYQESDAIIQGDTKNSISAVCEGDTLTLFVNGIKVDEVMDNSFDSGEVGLIAGTFDDVGTDVLFDNFAVFEHNE